MASVDYDCTVTSANYSWRANDWVHLRFEWDDSPASGPEQRIVINQAVPTQTCPGNFTSPGGSPGPNIDFRFGDINDGAATFGAGVYDEIYSFGGSSTTPTPLPNGGLAMPGREYLGDTAQNYQLTFVTREDVTFRGPRLFVGSDSKFLGLNIALAIKGCKPGCQPPDPLLERDGLDHPERHGHALLGPRFQRHVELAAAERHDVLGPRRSSRTGPKTLAPMFDGTIMVMEPIPTSISTSTSC